MEHGTAGPQVALADALRALDFEQRPDGTFALEAVVAERYDYRIDYAATRAAVAEAASKAGYRFELVLLERSL